MNLVEAVRTPEQRTQFEAQLLEAGLGVAMSLSVALVRSKVIPGDGKNEAKIHPKCPYKRSQSVPASSNAVKQIGTFQNNKHKFPDR